MYNYYKLPDFDIPADPFYFDCCNNYNNYNYYLPNNYYPRFADPFYFDCCIIIIIIIIFTQYCPRFADLYYKLQLVS